MRSTIRRVNPDRAIKKSKAVALRRKGYSYLEISTLINVPRSTIVGWCAGVRISSAGRSRLDSVIEQQRDRARENSVRASRERKESRKRTALQSASSFGPYLTSISEKRAVLGALYLAEGTKGERGALTFGNSDPEIIRLFLSLLRECFVLDETKFRCTLQARDGQDIAGLEKFWSKTTGIPLTKFYNARIDPRSGGKLTRRPEYKGVCRIDYLSTSLLYEVLAIGTILTKGP